MFRTLEEYDYAYDKTCQCCGEDQPSPEYITAAGLCYACEEDTELDAATK